ncbi:hypothetical protein COLO4_38310 [Corchorus olitorius]|uniref:Uncharacterized protein n=1 Tax=Corchorus olitorius TaxID=93759 RepID=A0A1R3FVN5_9ROSI|nr:hypothetical protein COLO4_38310 [Corchorus olitorius]
MASRAQNSPKNNTRIKTGHKAGAYTRSMKPISSMTKHISSIGKPRQTSIWPIPYTPK